MFEFSTEREGVALEPLETSSGKKIYRVTEWDVCRSYGGTRSIYSRNVEDHDSIITAYEQFLETATKLFILSKPDYCQPEELLRLGRRHAKLSTKSILALFANQRGEDCREDEGGGNDEVPTPYVPPVSGSWWVPNLRLSKATALAVPLGQPYHQAVQDKLAALLEATGKKASRAAVQAYLEPQEMDILPLDFPDGWAEQILTSGTMPELVAMGDPEDAEPADQELMMEAVDGQGGLSLAEFLAAAPA